MSISRKLGDMLETVFARVRFKHASHQSGEAEAEKENRRADQRFDVKRYNANIRTDGLRHPFRLRDLSCTGVSGITAAPIEDEQPVSVELVKGILWPATVRWTRGTSVGLSFGRPLPMYFVAAILEADEQYCRPDKDGELNLGPLTNVELSIVNCPLEESNDPGEDPAHGASTDQDPHAEDTEEYQDVNRNGDERAEDGLDPSGEEVERRAEPRIRILHLIATITSGNVSGLCCLRSISDCGLMAETNLVLKPGDEVELKLSDRHRLCGRVVWRDQAGAGVALDEPIDSVLLMSELVGWDAEPPQEPAPEA